MRTCFPPLIRRDTYLFGTLLTRNLTLLLGPADNVDILRRAAEPPAATARDLRHHRVRQHVDAQRGGSADDDAGGHRDPAADTGGGRRLHCRPRLLQGGGAGGYILCRRRRDEHADWDRRESDIGGDVEELLPGCGAHQLQRVVLLWVSPGCCHLLGSLGDSLWALLFKRTREGFVCFPGQGPSQKRARTVG